MTYTDYHNFAIQIYENKTKCWKVLYYCQMEDDSDEGSRTLFSNNNNKRPIIDWFFPTNNNNNGSQFMDSNEAKSKYNPSDVVPVKDYPLFIGNPYYSEEEIEKEDSDSEKTNSPWNMLRDDNPEDMYLEVTPETSVLRWDEVVESENGAQSSSLKEHYDIMEWFVTLAKYQLYLDPSTTTTCLEEQQPQDIMEFDSSIEKRLRSKGLQMKFIRQTTYENCLKTILLKTPQQFPLEVITNIILPFVGTPTHLRKVRIHYSYGNDK